MRFLTFCLFVLALTPLALGTSQADSNHLGTVMTDSDRIHLLSRTGFGASPADRIALEGLTRQQGVDHIIDGLRVTPSLAMPAWTRHSLPHYHRRGSLPQAQRGAFDQARDREIASLRNWWATEMLQTDSPATERLVLLWHDLVPTAYRAIGRHSLAMARQNALFRASIQGDWGVLLKSLIRDPALLRYLNGDRNLREQPNENLARELLELFTLGEGIYDEATVREAARSLTGHGVDEVTNLSFILRPSQKDWDSKTLFDAVGNFDGDDLIDRILDQPAAARHLARVYWHHFISDRKPSDGELDALAVPFRESGHSLAVLYRTVLESDAFWDPDLRASLVKSPVDIATGLTRSLDFPKKDWAVLPALQASMGLNFFDPPNVAGWSEGDAWLAPGRLLARFDAAAALVDTEGELASEDVSGGMSGGMNAGMSSDEAEPMMTSDGMMVSDATPGDSTIKGPRLILDVASEAYLGPVQLTLALLDAGGAAVWQSPVQTLSKGRDTGRLGRMEDPTDLPRERLQFAVSHQQQRQAAAVRVAYLTDAAGPDGDRNLYIERVRLGNREALPQGARQQSDCPPEDEASAGHLWCQGTVTMALTRADDEMQADSKPLIEGTYYRWSASAVRVMGARINQGNNARIVRLILEHVRGPREFDAELVQFRLVRSDKGSVDLQLGSFDCRPRDACVPEWPDCAWSHLRYPPLKRVSIRVDPADEAVQACAAGDLPAVTQALLSALVDALPQLLDHVWNDTTRADWLAIIDEMKSGIGGRDSTAAAGANVVSETHLPWRIDPLFTPPAPLPEAVAPVLPAVADPLALQAAAEVHGLDPVAALLPGVDGLVDVIAPAELPIHERLRAVLAHPAFQLH